MLRQTVLRSLTICLVSLALAGCREESRGTTRSTPDTGAPGSTTETAPGVPVVADSEPAPPHRSSESTDTVPGPVSVESPSPEVPSDSAGAATTGAEGSGISLASGERTVTSTETPGSLAAQGAVAPAAEAPPRQFRVEGPNGAVRITYDDIDLLKLLQMEPVTPDCVEQMPAWLRSLNGKQVRIRGFMKPDFFQDGIRRFLLVRDTGLCCFGPAGKVYDLIKVTLEKGATTHYIELRPFDVVGTFRIQVEILDDMVYELYYIDDAKIIQK